MSISMNHFFLIFVLTFSLQGGLYHVMFRFCLFTRCWCLWVVLGWTWDCNLSLLFFSACWYGEEVLFKMSPLVDLLSGVCWCSRGFFFISPVDGRFHGGWTVVWNLASWIWYVSLLRSRRRSSTEEEEVVKVSSLRLHSGVMVAKQRHWCSSQLFQMRAKEVGPLY